MSVPRIEIDGGEVTSFPSVASPLNRGSLSSDQLSTSPSTTSTASYPRYNGSGLLNRDDDRPYSFVEKDGRIEEAPKESRTARRFQGIWSIRNVLIAMNVFILSITVVLLTVVGHALFSKSAIDAAIATSGHVANQAAERLGSSLGNIAQHQFVLGSSLEIDNIQLNDTVLSHLLAYQWLVAPEEVSSYYFANIQGSNEQEMVVVTDVLLDSFLIGVLNTSINHNVTFYPLSDDCLPKNISCQLYNVSDPLETSFLDISTRPWYTTALTSDGTGFTPVYLFEDKNLGITAARALHDPITDDFIGIVATDIRLIEFNIFLSHLVNGILGNDTGSVLFVVERKLSHLVPSYCSQDGILIGWTVDDEPTNMTDPSCPVLVSEAQNPTIRSVVDFIHEQCGSWINGIHGEDACQSFQDSGNTIVLNHLAFANLEWTVVSVIPSTIYTKFLNRTYSIVIPIVTPLVFLIAIVASILFTTYITRPLKRTTTQLLHASNLDFDKLESSTAATKTHMLEFHEVKKINRAMLTMASGLRSFAKYVPREVVMLLVKLRHDAVLGVDERELSIFFSDIADFTTISEELEPGILVGLMADYLQAMSDIILESKGVVDKFIGDGIMAFWNAPLTLEEHAVIACGVALKCQAKLLELQDKWTQKSYPMISTRIGINSGKALVGNLGAPERLNFTCIGDNVNLASRLEGLNKYFGTGIAISETTYQTVKSAFICRLVGLIAVKGKNRAIKVYELVGTMDETPKELADDCKEVTAAVELYLSQNFVEAKAKFENYLARHPKDKSAKIHTQLCHLFIKAPPGTYENTFISVEGGLITVRANTTDLSSLDAVGSTSSSPPLSPSIEEKWTGALVITDK